MAKLIDPEDRDPAKIWTKDGLWSIDPDTMQMVSDGTDPAANDVLAYDQPVGPEEFLKCALVQLGEQSPDGRFV